MTGVQTCALPILTSFDSSKTASQMFTKAQAECVAKGVVDEVGVDTLKAAGVTPADFAESGGPFKAAGNKLSRKQAEGVVSVITDGKCFDFTDLVTKAASSGSAAFGKLAKDKVRCLFDNLLKGKAFKQAMVDSILGRSSGSSDAFAKAFSGDAGTFAVFSKCNIKPSELRG